MDFIRRLILLADEAAPAGEAAGEGAGAGVNPFWAYAPFIAIIALFYVLMIAPERRKRQVHEQMLGQLKKNDEVLTSSGIYGRVVSIAEDRVVLRVDDNARLTVHRSTIGHVLNAKPEEPVGEKPTPG
jgi:preprotein translocase subunit YajC